jgi:outer membrane biosynthesis protein TonB
MAENPFKKVGSFIADELLGFDDARNVVAGLKEGDLKKAAKAAGAGVLEIGSTVAAAAAAAPTLGGSVAAKGAQVAAKQAAKAGVNAAVRNTGGGNVGQQFRGSVETLPKIKPVKPKPGDLPGAPGYPRTPTKPGDLPGAPGYPKPAPAPAPAPKPLPKPLPKPAPAPVKPAPAPKPEPKPKPAVAPKPKPAKGTKPKSSTSTSAKSATNLPKFTRQFSKLSVPTAMGAAYLLGKKSDKKDEGPWNPSAIV